MRNLTVSAGVVLDEALIFNPGLEIPRRLGLILEKMDEIAQHTIDVDEPDQARVLKATTELMYEISTGTEYLRSILGALASHKGMEKKISHLAVKTIDRLAALEFKVPLNKIKHEGFELAWVTLVPDGKKPVHGFTVNGLVRPKVIGSGHHRFGKALSEGYSFSLFLRRAIEVFFLQCQQVEEAVRTMFAKELQSAPGQPAEGGPQQMARRVVERLALLTFDGFQNEHLQRVSELAFVDGSIVIVRTRMLRFKVSGYTVRSHVVARGGHAFQLPFWQRPKS